MEDTSIETIQSLLGQQRSFFASQRTKDIRFRIEQLKKFKAGIQKYEQKITDALWADLHKSYEEAYLTEISILYQEIDNHLQHLHRWAKPKRVITPLPVLPASSKIIYEPLGVALIIAPWNYPFQLLMNPVVGAISAGCCAMLKPSPYTPAVAKVMEEMIADTFAPEYIATTQGGRNVNTLLLEQRFDVIFFTGSPMLGKIVMKAAAEYLTPVVLELGGKSPCIVDANADIGKAAKRIAWGKALNAGQTCVAPDYLFVHESVKQQLLNKIGENFEKMFAPDISQNKYFPRIVSQQAVDRIQALMQHGNIVFGGKVNRDEKYISPTIIDNVQPDFPIMQEEIFGPVLPVMTFTHIEQVIKYVNAHEKPLAFYYFGKNKQAKDILFKTTSGGGCVNDTIIHLANHYLPFGGVGNSGMGKYHGHDSFLAFSNARSILTNPTWIDLPFKYAPYKRFKLTKKLL